MKQPTITATALVKESEKITGQIQDVETQHGALQDELSALDRRLDLLAGQEEVDEKAVADCLSRKQAVMGESDFLKRRAAALQQKKAATERAEAGARLEQVAEEAGRLVLAESEALPAYARGIDALKAAVSALVEIHRQHRELNLESVFWMEKYGLSRPSLSQLSELPDLNSLVTTLGQLFAPLHTTGIDSEWTRKRQQLSRHPELRQQREEPTQVQARPEERPVPRTTTIAVRPDHEEDRTPNKMTALLRNN
jgi:hypothetical protein